MICGEAKRILLPYAEDRLPAGARADLEAHLEECDSCREEAERIRANSELLRESLATLADEARPDLAFLAEFGVRKPAKGGGAPAGRRRVLLLILVAAGAAALALGAWLLLRNGDEEPTPGPERGAAVRDRRPERDRRPTPDRPAAPPRVERVPEPEPEPEPGPEPEPEPEPRPRFTGSEKTFEVLVQLLLDRPYSATMDRVWASYRKNPAPIDGILDRIQNESDAQKRALLLLALVPARDLPAVVGEAETSLGRDGAGVVRIAAAALLAAARDATVEGDRVTVVNGIRVPVAKIEDPARRDGLLRALEAEREPGVIAAFARILGPSAGSDEGVLSDLKELSWSENPEIRAAAEEGLRRALPEDPRETLERIEDSEYPIGARVRMVESLLLVKRPLPLLARLVRSDEAEIRGAAVDGLGEIWDDGGRSRVLGVLKGSDETAVRVRALSVLMAKGGDRREEILRRLGSDRDPEMARAIAEALRQVEMEREGG